MIYTHKEKYSDFINDSVAYLKLHGFENIKADVEGYETPKSYSKVGSDISITPYCCRKRGKKTYF